MSRLRRRPVVYRSQVCLWVVAIVVAIASTVLFVAGGHRQVVALVVQGVSVLAAMTVWRFGEYRARRLGPPTADGFNGWSAVGILAMVVISNTIAKGGSFGASVAGIATGVAAVAPWLIFATALRDPPPAPSSVASDQPSPESNQADRDRAGPADGPRT